MSIWCGMRWLSAPWPGVNCATSAERFAHKVAGLCTQTVPNSPPSERLVHLNDLPSIGRSTP